jgi:dynein heavy chain
LEAALPVLEAAKLALQNLSKNEVTEIRSFAKPPKAVQVSLAIPPGHIFFFAYKF